MLQILLAKYRQLKNLHPHLPDAQFDKNENLRETLKEEDDDFAPNEVFEDFKE